MFRTQPCPRLTKLSPIASGSITSPSNDTAAHPGPGGYSPNITIDAHSNAKSDHDIQSSGALSSSQPSHIISSQPRTEGDAGAAIDPIFKQITERTKSHHNLLPLHHTEASLGASEKSHAGSNAPDVSAPATVRRVDSVSSVNKGFKDKKGASVISDVGDAVAAFDNNEKGVSLFSRFIGTKKKGLPDFSSAGGASSFERVPTDPDTEVFSRPIGFVPQFPAPPRYIKVRAYNRKRKEFERVFLAQVLLERNQGSRRKISKDEESVHVGEAPGSLGEPYSRAIWAMEFSKDGRFLAAAGQDKKVRVWTVIRSTEDREAHEAEEEEKGPEQPNIRLNAPVLRKKLIREYQGHNSSILDLSWSKNNFLLSSSMDKTVRLWHISRGECLCAFKHQDFVTSIAFHPQDDRFFLAGSLDAKLRLWSIPDKALAYMVNVPDMVTAVAFTPDGKTCIAGCLNGLCLFYETERLKLHSQLHVRSARGRNAKGSKITGIETIIHPPADHQGDVKVLITSNDSRIRMYNLKDRNLEIKFRGNENTCSQIHATFSDDGKHVICGSEDKKIYIWPTGPTEKQEQDRRPLETLEAHTAIVTVAILAPTMTRQHLAQSSDPIYDICNPPPVTLMGNDSILSTHAATESGQSAKNQVPTSPPKSGHSCQRAEGTPAYLARHAHPGGNIIVTADYQGQIKILRQDCAFQKRRYESFDSASMFSRNRLLGRSGSVTTRTSLSSARSSMGYNNPKSPSTDRILKWRSSITNTTSNPDSTIFGDIHTNLHRARSISPRKTGETASSPHQRSAVKAPSLNNTSSSPSRPKSSNEISVVVGRKPAAILASATSETNNARQNYATVTGSEVRLNPLHSDPGNVFNLRDHSYRYWKPDKFITMAQEKARSVGSLHPGEADQNPSSRERRFTTRLSSDSSSDARATSGADEDKGEEVECQICGGRSFRVKVGQKQRPHETQLSCKRCGNVI